MYVYNLYLHNCKFIVCFYVHVSICVHVNACLCKISNLRKRNVKSFKPCFVRYPWKVPPSLSKSNSFSFSSASKASSFYRNY